MYAKLKLMLTGLLMLASAVFAFLHAARWHFLVCAALGFSFIGDALLAHYPPFAARIKDPFLPGMGAFAVAQGLYILAFHGSMQAVALRHTPEAGDVLGSEILPSMLLIYLLVGILFFIAVAFRAEQPVPLRVAALFYALLVCTMAAHALSAAFTGDSFVWPLFYGGVLFILSDGVIALHVFQQRFEDERFYEGLVWGTYFPAQLLLLLGTSWLR